MARHAPRPENDRPPEGAQVLPRAAELEERQLVSRCVAGERAATDELVVRFGRLVYAVVLRTLQRHGQATGDDRIEELFGASFVALLESGGRRLAQWDGRCTLASWIRLVAASTTLDAVRSEQRRVRRTATEVDFALLPADGPSALEHAVAAEALHRVELGLATLSEGDRELLRLLFVEDLAPGDVASRLGIAAGALYTRKNRALQRLRAMLESEL